MSSAIAMYPIIFCACQLYCMMSACRKPVSWLASSTKTTRPKQPKLPFSQETPFCNVRPLLFLYTNQILRSTALQHRSLSQQQIEIKLFFYLFANGQSYWCSLHFWSFVMTEGVLSFKVDLTDSCPTWNTKEKRG